MTWLMRSMQLNDFFDKSKVVKSVMTSLKAVKEWLFEKPNKQPRLVTYITYLVTCESRPEGRPQPLVRVWKKIPYNKSKSKLAFDRVLLVSTDAMENMKFPTWNKVSFSSAFCTLQSARAVKLIPLRRKWEIAQVTWTIFSARNTICGGRRNFQW